MICLTGNLPVLKVGSVHAVGYGSCWIDEALRRAAESAGHPDCPFLADIRDGILHFLEFRCSLKVLPLEKLFARMEHLLRKIGYEEIAAYLRPLSPPVSYSLIKPAQEAGNGFELTFFKILGDEIDLLQSCGAETIDFCDLEAGVKVLKGAKTMTKPCEHLAAEIVAYLERFQKEQIPPRDLKVTVIQ